MLLRNWIASLGMVAVASALLPGCELQSCTDMGCGSALRVEFAGGQWEAGEYEITVMADGVTTICAATLPFASCETSVSCDRSDSGFWVLHSGCALGSSEHKLDGVEWSGEGPAQVTVELRRDGTLLGSASEAPTYRTSYPNGEDCDPVCQHSDLAVTVSL